MEKAHIRLQLFGQSAYEALARAREPDMALVYVFVAAHGGACAEEMARDSLSFEPDRMKKALSLLRLHGLVSMPGSAPAKSEYVPRELAEAREGDHEFGGLCGYLEAALGRALRKSEMETLYGVYDMLNLPAEVLVLIINLCKANERLSAREIEKQAYKWHDQGIDTYERAEKYLGEQKRLRSRIYGIQRVLGITDRKPSDSEKRYIDGWIDMDTPDELVRLAYDRTVIRTGKLVWEYMDTILKAWRASGYKTAAQVEKYDKAPAAKPDEAAGESVEAAVRRRFERRRLEREMMIKERMEEALLSPEFAEIERKWRLTASRAARSRGEEKLLLEGEVTALSAARTALLRGMGKPDDWLDNIPDCPLCDDRGYIGSRRCRCLELACAEEEAARKGAKKMT